MRRIIHSVVLKGNYSGLEVDQQQGPELSSGIHEISSKVKADWHQMQFNTSNEQLCS